MFLIALGKNGIKARNAITILKLATSTKEKTTSPFFIKIKELPQINAKHNSAK